MIKKSYKIKTPHFYCLEYYENDKIMKLDKDLRDSIIYLNTDLIENWLLPFESVEITLEEK